MGKEYDKDRVTTRGKQHSHSSFKLFPKYDLKTYKEVTYEADYLFKVCCDPRKYLYAKTRKI